MNQPGGSPTMTVDMGEMTSAKVVTAINQSQKAMNKLLATCLGHHGLTVSEWTFLGCLADGPKTPTEIAKLMDVKTPYVTIIIREFRKKEVMVFAEISNHDDTRSKMISMTNDGKQYVAHIEEKLQGCIQRELAQKIAPSDLVTYFMVSDFIAKNVRHRDI